MKRREAKGALSADLLVCFPSRTNLKLMPKPICSPARPSEPNYRHHHHHQQHQLVKKSSIGRSGLGHASPLMWAKTKSVGSEISEPTSPKVTCAGQIKVPHKSGSCKSWQSVMEEIERIHNNKKQRKQRRPHWAEAFGFKKEVMQFLTCLRSIRFDLRCFGSFPHESDITSDGDEDEEDEEENRDGRENHVGGVGISDGSDQSSSRTVFSKWFMVLQENQSNGFCKEDKKERNRTPNFDDGVGIGSTSEAPAAVVPPPNALLLMRCRSAPAKTWLEEKEEEEEEEEDDDEEEEEEEDDDEEEEEEEEDGDDEGGENGLEKEEKQAKVTLRSLMEEDKQKKKMENLVVMAYDSDLYNISSDIAKETWVVGGLKEAISRSRSWKI